jgi:4-amino-4-deoxy-L-arabinose transferase-like glycosyltransferase
MARSILTAADTAAPSGRTHDSLARTATGGWVRALGLVAALGLVIRLVYTYVHGDNLAALGIDAGYYHNAANLLADGKWFVSPVGLFNFYGVGQAATHPPAYQVLLGIVSALGMRSVLFHQLWSCVIGGAAVALVGFTGLEVAGRRVGLLAAAIAAIVPTFWVNDALLMSESLVLAVVALVLLLAYRFCRRPTLVSAAALGVATGITVLTRAELVLLVPLLLVPLVVLAARPAWRQGVRLLVAAGLAALIVVTPGSSTTSLASTSRWRSRPGWVRPCWPRTAPRRTSAPRSGIGRSTVY